MTKQYTNMLVDGRNALYRAVYAGLKDKRFQDSGADYFTILMRFLHHYFISFKPDQIHIFWDDKSSNLWRTDMYPEYKGTRDNSEISDTLQRQYRLALDLFRFMGFRQYYRPKQEADDLIYSFCRSFKEPTVVISSDSDLKQIPYTMSHVDLYNPTAKAGRSSRGAVLLEDIPPTDIVIVKSLTGDKSDNIEGYYKVGPVKGKQYALNLKNRVDFMNSDKAIVLKDEIRTPVGDSVFRRNRQLIDLGLCPDLLDNMMYVEKHRSTPIQYNYKTIVTKLRDNGVSGAIAEADKYIVQFSELLLHGEK